MMYFHSYKNPGFIVDIVGDIRKLNDMSVRAKKAGMIVLGGGVCKHQIANAMLFVSSRLPPFVLLVGTAQLDEETIFHCCPSSLV